VRKEECSSLIVTCTRVIMLPLAAGGIGLQPTLSFPCQLKADQPPRKGFVDAKFMRHLGYSQDEMIGSRQSLRLFHPSRGLSLVVSMGDTEMECKMKSGR